MGEPAEPTIQERNAAIARAEDAINAVINDERSWFDNIREACGPAGFEAVHDLFVMMQLLLKPAVRAVVENDD